MLPKVRVSQRLEMKLNEVIALVRQTNRRTRKPHVRLADVSGHTSLCVDINRQMGSLLIGKAQHRQIYIACGVVTTHGFNFATKTNVHL